MRPRQRSNAYKPHCLNTVINATTLAARLVRIFISNHDNCVSTQYAGSMAHMKCPSSNGQSRRRLGDLDLGRQDRAVRTSSRLTMAMPRLLIRTGYQSDYPAPGLHYLL